MSDNQPCVNTDRELWRETPGDYYAPRIFVTEGGGIGIDVGGRVHVRPVRDWHLALVASERLREIEGLRNDVLQAEAAYERAQVMVDQLKAQVEFLKAALAEANNQIAIERAANPSTAKSVAISALESILQHNKRLIADEVLKEVRPEAQAYIERCLAEREPR